MIHLGRSRVRPCGQSLRPCRQGCRAARVSPWSCLAMGLDGPLARGLRARAWRGRRGLQLSALGRRHCEDSRSARHIDHRDWHCSGAKNRLAARRRGGRPPLCDRTIGDAALGLQLRAGAAQDREWTKCVSQADAAYLAGRYLLPQPRLCLREALHAHAHAAMDISDGLAGDLAKILDLTGMTAEVMAADVPLSKAARKLVRHAPSLLETIFTGGDDYELLCAVPPSQSAAFEARAIAADYRCIRSARPSRAICRQRSRIQTGRIWSSRSLPSGIFKRLSGGRLQYRTKPNCMVLRFRIGRAKDASPRLRQSP